MVVDAGMLTTDIIIWCSILIAVLAMALAGEGHLEHGCSWLVGIMHLDLDLHLCISGPHGCHWCAHCT